MPSSIHSPPISPIVDRRQTPSPGPRSISPVRTLSPVPSHYSRRTLRRAAGGTTPVPPITTATAVSTPVTTALPDRRRPSATLGVETPGAPPPVYTRYTLPFHRSRGNNPDAEDMNAIKTVPRAGGSRTAVWIMFIVLVALQAAVIGQLAMAGKEGAQDGHDAEIKSMVDTLDSMMVMLESVNGRIIEAESDLQKIEANLSASDNARAQATPDGEAAPGAPTESPAPTQGGGLSGIVDIQDPGQTPPAVPADAQPAPNNPAVPAQ